MNFNQAKQACEDEGSVLSMPRTVVDISDIKEFDRKYSLYNSLKNCQNTFFIHDDKKSDIYFKLCKRTETSSGSSSVVKTYNPWGDMTNNGLKNGVNSQADAENYLKYLDGTAYTHIPGLVLDFNDPSPSPFRIIENNDGDLLLADHSAGALHEILCQYDCQGKLMNICIFGGWGSHIWF